MKLDDLDLAFIEELQKIPYSTETVFSNLNPIQMIKTLTSKYGHDWVVWDNVQTLHHAIDRDFIPGFSSNQKYWVEKNFVNALKVMCHSDSFWLEYEVFEKCCHSLDKNIVMFGISQPCSPAQCLLGLKVANFIRNHEFNPEIISYVASVCEFKNLIYLPEELSIAQTSLDLKNKHPKLKEDTKRIWELLKNKNAEIVDISMNEDNQVDWQIMNIYAITQYVKEKMEEK
jgi:hypothetical protein